jgi:ketosteroid isomerase-like protein
MYKLIFSSLIVLLTFTATAQHSDEKAIRAILDNQQQAWNAGDVDKFMVGYWNNDSLMFIGSNGPTYGYAKTLANYKKGYPDIAHMGKFTSTVISMKKLSAEYYFVTGKWYLKRTVGDAKGYYTLLFRKVNGNWVIISDHSS